MSTADDQFDAIADQSILECLNIENPRSFFLYAGAGSGKTRSLVEAIRVVCREQGKRLSLTGQKIGVITFTNAACDEIKQRLEFDPRVEVSTIHSFAWSLIAGYNSDIRKWVAARLLQDVAGLKQEQAKGRPNSKAAGDRTRSIESKMRRYEALNATTKFIYSPTGDNRTRDSLNHSEVIAMTADFLSGKAGLRRLLVSRFPILLIDESQDTNGRLMEVMLEVAGAFSDTFCLGLFGDTMQRIYADGKVHLADAIPDFWAKPRKVMNHRCPIRVVTLINKIRANEDGQEQQHRSDANVGIVRLFVLPETTIDKASVELSIAARMSEITGDKKWSAGFSEIKILALEHSMSARRFGFEAFFEPLYAVERIRTSFLQGTGAGIGFFTREVLPLVIALRSSDRFAALSIARQTSPLIDRKTLQHAGDDQLKTIQGLKEVCDGLLELVTAKHPTLRSVLNYVAETGLFVIPDVLAPFVVNQKTIPEDEVSEDLGEENDVDLKSEFGGWRQALEAPFEQIEKYNRYVTGLSQFDTHQGVKGLEFPRVMVIVSDEEARGFMFAYDKLFGVKGSSETDLKNEAAGKETTINRTRRLFYVTCSRAEESLAVVYYASNPTAALEAMIRKGWFDANETELFPQAA